MVVLVMVMVGMLLEPDAALQARENEMVTLTDAATDVEELALTMDEDEKVTWCYSS
jgi:hypothetical protein